ncbi:unnamed protein product [Linum trigynum]|uniref:Uncharacterized protein n=1 Tax=Linum trigynum TaxID=586398 RepID=A0AAV2CUZ1_9ROSI
MAWACSISYVCCVWSSGLFTTRPLTRLRLTLAAYHRIDKIEKRQREWEGEGNEELRRSRAESDALAATADRDSSSTARARRRRRPDLRGCFVSLSIRSSPAHPRHQAPLSGSPPPTIPPRPRQAHTGRRVSSGCH